MNSRKTIRYTMEDVAPAVAMLQKSGLVALLSLIHIWGRGPGTPPEHGGVRRRAGQH